MRARSTVEVPICGAKLLLNLKGRPSGTVYTDRLQQGRKPKRQEQETKLRGLPKRTARLAAKRSRPEAANTTEWDGGDLQLSVRR